MSESNSRKRNLPSWMSSREEENEESEKSKPAKNRGNSKKDRIGEDQIASAASSSTSDFSRLMEGVTFVLSGFVNPERGTLRSQMLEMGAEYQPDWNSDCTLLVCAFSNTPKFRQVKADGGTVISKDWISESYTQKKLVDIEPFLLHAGKPWRKQCISHEARKDVEPTASNKSSKKEETVVHPKKETVEPTASNKSSKKEETVVHPKKETVVHSKKATGSSKMKGSFSPSKAKKWAVEDLKRTISWLENQEEKPGPSEIKKIAAEGILTCLQDAIDALKQGQGIKHVTEQWGCLPRVVEELSQFDGSTSPSKQDLCREVMACKQIYELEFLNMEHVEIPNGKKPQNHGTEKGGKNDKAPVNDPYDSDATLEMTEDEIDHAYNSIASSL